MRVSHVLMMLCVVSGLMASTALAQPIASSIVVRAASSCGTIEPRPLMGVYVNRKLVARITVANGTYADYTVNLPADTYIHHAAVAFMNDNQSGGCDHNLFVESIRVGGLVIPATAPGVVYDRGGTAALMFDDQDVIAPTNILAWNGALRFFIAADDARPHVIVCEKNLSPTPAYGNYTYTFNASDCGGILPDTNYVGMLSKTGVCGHTYSWTALDAGEVGGPGITFWWDWTCGPAATRFRVVYISRN